MATEALLPLPRQIFTDANGVPLAGGLVHTYIPNTTTPKTTWQDAGGTTPNANPITLDAAGSCLIYGAGSYQLTVTDANGVSVPAYSGVTQSFGGISPAGTFDTIAALRANTGTPALTQAWVGGYYTVADGGEGMFWYNSSDTTSLDNGGTIIVDASGNRWYREYVLGTIQCVWFGAKGDGVTDATSAIQAAINVIAGTSPNTGTITFGPGTFVISSTITLPIGINLIGSGSTNPYEAAWEKSVTKIIWNGATNGIMLQTASCYQGTIQNMFWDGAFKAGTIWFLAAPQGGLFQNCQLRRLSVTTTKAGLWLDVTGQTFPTGGAVESAADNTFINVHIRDMTFCAAYLNGATGTTVVNCQWTCYSGPNAHVLWIDQAADTNQWIGGAIGLDNPGSGTGGGTCVLLNAAYPLEDEFGNNFYGTAIGTSFNADTAVDARNCQTFNHFFGCYLGPYGTQLATGNGTVPGQVKFWGCQWAGTGVTFGNASSTNTSSSPYTYTNSYNTGVQQELAFWSSGGSVTGVNRVRNGVTFGIAPNAGTVLLEPGDSTIVTFTGTLQVNVVPH